MFGQAKSADQIMLEHMRELFVDHLMRIAKERPDVRNKVFELILGRPDLREIAIKRAQTYISIRLAMRYSNL